MKRLRNCDQFYRERSYLFFEWYTFFLRRTFFDGLKVVKNFRVTQSIGRTSNTDDTLKRSLPETFGCLKKRRRKNWVELIAKITRVFFRKKPLKNCVFFFIIVATIRRRIRIKNRMCFMAFCRRAKRRSNRGNRNCWPAII